jgi:hypothetical protein
MIKILTTMTTTTMTMTTLARPTRRPSRFPLLTAAASGLLLLCLALPPSAFALAYRSSWPALSSLRTLSPPRTLCRPSGGGGAVTPSSLHGTSKKTDGAGRGGRTPTTMTMKAEDQGPFKAGLLANVEEEAALLAAKKVRSLDDLGWETRGKPGLSPRRRRRSSVRPKFWAWGGATEVPLQDKPNYDPANNPNTPDRWLSLEELYVRLDDDTAVADTIFVALAGGRAFCERDVADRVLDLWWGTGGGDDSEAAGQKQMKKKKQPSSFNRAAFYQTVQRGRQEFLAQWAAFLGVTGFAVAGIVFPTNPLQMALVDVLDGVVFKR